MALQEELNRVIAAKESLRTALVNQGYPIPENSLVDEWAAAIAKGPTFGHEYVDLGLRSNGKKILFATCNIGAETPTDIGTYFSWGQTSKAYSGDTVPMDIFTQAASPYYDSTNSVYTKYNSTDGKTALDLSDDVAHVLWGGNWRMPTLSELQFLYDGTYVQVSTMFIGTDWAYKVTGKGQFSNNYILIPKDTGYATNNEVRKNTDVSTMLSSRELDSDKTKRSAITFSYDMRYMFVPYFDSTPRVRSNGLVVRPVFELPE